MTLSDFLHALRTAPDTVSFADTVAVIESIYHFTPTAFRNGELENAAGQNSGSCKLFAFARIQGLSQQETLACFGEYYREVLADPAGTSHGNIRNFMKFGWEGVAHAGEALRLK